MKKVEIGKIPNEIWWEIGTHLPIPDVLSLIRTGRCFLWLQSLLYRKDAMWDAKALSWAVRSNNFRAATNSLIAHKHLHNVSIGRVNKYGMTPLAVAARLGNARMSLLLLDHGIPPDARDNHGCAAIHHASYRGHTAVVALLLSRGANPNIPDKEGCTALMLASRGCFVDIVSLLLNGGAEVNAKGTQGLTALHVCAEFDAFEPTQLGDNGSSRDGVGRIDILDMLLDYGAELNAMHLLHGTTLQLAALAGRWELVRLLLKRGADPFIPNNEGIAALHYSAWHGKEDIFINLLDHGLDIGMVTETGATPLHFAAAGGRHDIVKLCLSRGANIDAITTLQETPLYWAVENNHLRVVLLLLNHGAQCFPDSDGNSLLHVACRHGYCPLTAFLLERYTDINLRNDFMETPLHIASSSGHLEVVQLLLANDPDLRIVDNSGFTVLDNAIVHGHMKVARYILRRFDEAIHNPESPLSTWRHVVAQLHLTSFMPGVWSSETDDRIEWPCGYW